MTKTIVEKLNLHKYKRAAILNEPAESRYFAGLEGYDTSLDNSPYDLIFAFALDVKTLQEVVHQIVDGKHLQEKGYLFIAYPKKGNKAYESYIHRDELFPALGSDEEGYIGDSGIKFARMVGLDDVFTVIGLKSEARGRTGETGQTASKPSQRVDDYIDLIPEIERDLTGHPELLELYQSLTPGYRKDWARYVYSAKQEATRAKRREEMKMILQAGYKSRDLYRKDHP